MTLRRLCGTKPAVEIVEANGSVEHCSLGLDYSINIIEMAA
jgi:hypothetical protein